MVRGRKQEQTKKEGDVEEYIRERAEYNRKYKRTEKREKRPKRGGYVNI